MNHGKALAIDGKIVWLEKGFISSLPIIGRLLNKTHEKYNIHFRSQKWPLTCGARLITNF